MLWKTDWRQQGRYALKRILAFTFESFLPFVRVSLRARLTSLSVVLKRARIWNLALLGSSWFAPIVRNDNRESGRKEANEFGGARKEKEREKERKKEKEKERERERKRKGRRGRETREALVKLALGVTIVSTVCWSRDYWTFRDSYPGR